MRVNAARRNRRFLERRGRVLERAREKETRTSIDAANDDDDDAKHRRRLRGVSSAARCRIDETGSDDDVDGNDGTARE